MGNPIENRHGARGYGYLHPLLVTERVETYLKFISRRLGSGAPLRGSALVYKPTSQEPNTSPRQKGTPYVFSKSRPRVNALVIADGPRARIYYPATDSLSDILNREEAINIVRRLNEIT